jgi:hypothetical protein
VIALENILHAFPLSFVYGLRYSEREHITHGDCDRGGRCRRADSEAHFLKLMYRRREQNGVWVALKQRAIRGAFVRSNSEDGRVFGDVRK